MKIEVSRFTLTKRHALTISRGTSASSENLLVEVTHDGITGQGEMAPVSGGAVPETATTAAMVIERWRRSLEERTPWELELIERCLCPTDGTRAAYAAIDIAIHDWIGKRLGLPLWQLWGLDTEVIPWLSMTLGINTPEVVREILPEIVRRTGVKIMKVKLGSPAGADADQAMFAAAQESQPWPLAWRVDANGGWDVETARRMIAWLADRGVDYVEQPLPRGQEADLAAVHTGSPLPIYVDESVYVARDIPPLAAHMDGVNLKLMKCGGLREAMRIIHTARAHNLRVMIGCMSESSLSISAGAQLAPLVDALDLDSHLNLLDDPFCGAVLEGGRIMPNNDPGLGVYRRSN